MACGCYLDEVIILILPRSRMVDANGRLQVVGWLESSARHGCVEVKAQPLVASGFLLGVCRHT